MAKSFWKKHKEKILHFKKDKTFSIFFIFIFLLGSFFTFGIPPFQKPDENVHFFRSAALSKGGFFCINEGEKRIFKFPEKYSVFADKMDVYRIALNYDQKFPKRDLLTIESKLQNYGYEKQSNLEGFCGIKFVSYMPFIFSIIVGEVFNSVLLSFYLSRFIGLILFLIAIVWSYEKIKYSKLKWILLLYSVIPMVIFQASTIGSDYLHLAVIPVLFALNIDFLLNKRYLKKDIYLFILLIFVLIVSKGGYYFLSFLYFLVPSERISKSKRSYIIYTILFLFFSFLPAIMESFFGLGATNFQGSINPGTQMELLKDPIFSFNLLRNTLTEYLGFYYRGFIGIFGWVDYGLPEYLYTIWLLPVALVVWQISDSRIYKKFKWKFFIICAMFISTVLLILLIFYLTWNEVGASAVLGVQGRYFLQFTPYILLCLGWVVHLLRKSGKLRLFFLIFLLLFLLYEIINATYNRYYTISMLRDILFYAERLI